MSSISITNTFVAGDTITASEVNTNFTDITDVVNGDIDNGNIASGAAIDPAKLSAVLAYPTTKLSTGTIGIGFGNTGDTNARVSLDVDGQVHFGPGNAVSDVIIDRESAGVLAVRNLADSGYEDIKADNIVAAGTMTANAISITTAITVAQGGTNITSYTANDMIYATGATTLAKLGIGSESQVLTVVSGAPAWAAAPSPSRFTSSAQTLSAAGLLTLAHGLGATPYRVWGKLKCTTADLNYSVDDEVIIYPSSMVDWDAIGLGVYVDGTNVYVRMSSYFYIVNKTTGAAAALDTSDWELYIFAEV